MFAITLALCAFGAAALVYRYDMYDREPPLLLALTVALGVGAMSLASHLEAWTFERSFVSSRAALAAVAAVEEEGLKILVVLLIAVTARREFNDPMDGLIYGSMAGLGMAIEESVSLLGGISFAAARRLPPEELVRLCGHLVMGGIGGLPLGLALLRTPGWPVALALCPTLAIGLHFAWDWLALSTPREGWSVGATAIGITLMLSGLTAYGTLVALASEWSHRLFAPQRPGSLWGWPFNRVRRGASD
jgi:protease PrsW